ncbi:MAG: monofunctional biosynthetic peptidoglycan transglycosylase [Azospirillaceae bacterium]
MASRGRRRRDGTAKPAPARRSGWRRWRRRVLIAALVLLVGLPAGLTVIYRFVPVPATPLMVIRLFEGEGWRRDRIALDDLPRHVPLAVIAGEDNRFCAHHGFDLEQIRAAWEEWRAGGRLRGASTLSMQTAKNLFLWPGRDFLRKGLEAYLVIYLEALWPKRRIIEVYLNIAETGPGVYGVGAAAEAHFGRPAAELTPRQAALIAAVLPNPRRWSAGQPTGYIAGRATTLTTRMNQIDPIVDCLEP